MATVSGYDGLLEALKTLYSNSERPKKEAANAYLEAFQKSLPEEAVGPFRDAVVALLLKYSTGPRPILIALSVALATLAMQMSSWNTVLEDMASSFSQASTTWNALLQFISVLPEEVNESRKMSLTQDHLQDRIQHLLTDNAGRVLQLLSSYVQSLPAPSDANPLLFSCLNSWLREIPVASMMQTPLVDLTFQALSIDSFFENSVDLLCSIFRETNEVNDPEMVKLIEILFPS
ncbi:hypothetical protein MRB53_039089 [Persea americana]|nr:hypothetical protein MRB53_039089 [Persea americana]